jgi:hypothetical protein
MVVLTYYIKYTGGGMPYYIYNPIRVGIHIACICEKKGVGYHMELLRPFTPGEYILIFCTRGGT